MQTLRELWDYCRANQKVWMYPLLVILLGLGAFLVYVEGSAVAPFLYTLF